jgi:L-ribulose-5-phosphate 3-epimerase
MQIDRRVFLVAVGAAGLRAAPSGSARGMRLGVIAQVTSDPEAAILRVHDFGFPTCQIASEAFDPGTAERLRAALDRYGIEATSVIAGGPGPEIYDFYQGPQTIGLVPPEYRDARIAQIKKYSTFAHYCGIPAVQTHCGFIPENPNDALYKEAIVAIREVALYCKQNGQSFRCETGQETPITLLRAVRDVGAETLGVNFDPANLVMYGKGDPVEAVDILGPHILGVHAKDGLYPTNPTSLGREVPIGQGKVDFPALIRKLKEAGYAGPLTIERESAGIEQAHDILAAKEYLEKLI